MSAADDVASSSLPPIGSILKGGIDAIQPASVTFTKYVRVVLPLDGFVYWVKAGILTDETYISSGATNTANSVTADGAMHYMATQNQDKDSTYAINDVVFTTDTQLTDFNEASQSELYIGIFDGIRFSFQSQGMYSPASKLYHYTGNAIYPYMDSQIIDSADDIDTSAQIVSNALPFFLAMNSYTKQDWDLFENPITLYPSFLTPTNLVPSYGVLHNEPGNVRAQNMVPIRSNDGTTDQYVSEEIYITLYGTNNLQASNFVNFVLEYSQNHDYFGINTTPIVQDEKEKQDEMGILASKKTITFTVNYYQSASRSVSRQLIESAIVSYDVSTLTT